jgi:hypothetical protein
MIPVVPKNGLAKLKQEIKKWGIKTRPLCGLREPEPDVFVSVCGHPVETDPECGGYTAHDELIGCRNCREILGLES